MAVLMEDRFGPGDWEGEGQFEPLPEGTYQVSVTEAAVKTVDGREGPFRKLALRLKVVGESEHAGRALWDDVILNDKPGSRRRRARVWYAFGLCEKGASNVCVREEDLIGRECLVDVEVESYTRRDGSQGEHNRIPFSGFKRLEPGAGPAAAKDEDGAAPF